MSMFEELWLLQVPLFPYGRSAVFPVKLQVNATNLLNEVNQVCTTGFCYYDEGRKVVASVKYSF